MSFRKLRQRAVTHGKVVGYVETNNIISRQSDEERTVQNKVMNHILNQLNKSKNDVQEYQVEDHYMVFLLPPGSRNRQVVENAGGQVLSEDELGTRVRVPIHFDWRTRNMSLVCNTRFFFLLAIVAVCAMWIGWKWSTHDNMFNAITSSWGYLMK